MATKDCKSQTNSQKEKRGKKHRSKRKNSLERDEKNRHKRCIRRSKSGDWQYPPEFFNYIPPPNHNLLIGSIRLDTLNNARYMLSVVDDFFALEPEGITRDTFVGLSMLVGCVRQALYFESHCRNKE